jgi:hypothetical protein
MDNSKEIIEFTKQILNKTIKIDDAIDKALEPIKDYTDTIGDIIAPIKSLIAISNLKKRLTLKSFISNYAKQLFDNYQIDEEETLRLHNYFKDKKNIIYISDIIDNAINSKSLRATAILGAIAGKIIKEKNELTYDYLSIIETLRGMTDFDIDNFIILYEYLPIIGTSHDQTDEYRTRDFYKDENPNKIQVDKSSLELTIEKMKRTNGLTYNAGGIGQSGNGKGCFEIDEITRELYRLIKTTQIVE